MEHKVTVVSHEDQEMGSSFKINTHSKLDYVVTIQVGYGNESHGLIEINKDDLPKLRQLIDHYLILVQDLKD